MEQDDSPLEDAEILVAADEIFLELDRSEEMDRPSRPVKDIWG
jgi:hypothetical protein